MKTHTLEMTRAISQLTSRDVFFTAILYTLKIEAKADLPAPAATDGVSLYYHPKQFEKMFTAQERIFVLVHELLHVILCHSLRRGIRDPELWNIACDHVVNLLCEGYSYTKPKDCFCDAKYKGMTAEQVYDLLLRDAKAKGNPAGGKLSGDVLDYNPSKHEGKPASDVRREIAITTKRAEQLAKAMGQTPAGLARIAEQAQVQREPWYQHLRRWITSMHSRQYNWARIDSRRAVLHGVVSPQRKAESMGKIVFWVDCSGSITNAQLGAMGAHISDLLRDVRPSEVVVGYFDAKVCHVETFTGPDYQVSLSPHGGGGTDFRPMFAYMQEDHADAQVAIVFTDLYGSFGESNPVCDTLWVSQTESVNVPFGELIYGDLNES